VEAKEAWSNVMEQRACGNTGLTMSSGGQKQKGIITYGLSANRQNPFAGAFHAAIFNTWRRFSANVWYVVPPFVGVYFLMDWANRR
jgi:ubiquinol-cytochrome c reductase subunit 8